MSAMDDTDYYVEKLHPENPNLVMFKNEWVPLKVYDEEIIIKDEDSFKFQVKKQIMDLSLMIHPME